MKPQVNINLNIEVKANENFSEKVIESQIQDALSRAKLIQEQLSIDSIQASINEDAGLGYKNEKPATSRHYAAVEANNRISDAIAFIRKELKLQKGSTENGCAKILKELELILLGM